MSAVQVSSISKVWNESAAAKSDKSETTETAEWSSFAGSFEDSSHGVAEVDHLSSGNKTSKNNLLRRLSSFESSLEESSHGVIEVDHFPSVKKTCKSNSFCRHGLSIGNESPEDSTKINDDAAPLHVTCFNDAIPRNIFRLQGYRGKHRQYYYLTPVIDNKGNLVDEHHRNNTQDFNEWREPRCDCYQQGYWESCNICGRPSVFGPWLFSTPSRSRDNQKWRENYAKMFKGNFFRIWAGGEKEVRITDKYLKGRGGGVLSFVQQVRPEELGEHKDLLVSELL